MATKNWTQDQFARKSLNDGSSDFWTASGSGTNEYYYNQTDVDHEPLEVWSDSGGAQLTRGTAGSLNGGEWDYADNDSIGGNRIYVRLSDGTDPDTKSSGYMLCVDTFTLIDEGAGETPVVVNITLANLASTQAMFKLIKTDSSDNEEFRAKVAAPADNSPVDWTTKLFLNDSDKLKLQCDTVDVSAILSGDV